FFFSSRRRHTRSYGDWSSDVCSSDLEREQEDGERREQREEQGPAAHQGEEPKGQLLELGERVSPLLVVAQVVQVFDVGHGATPQIGRASCRERVQLSDGECGLQDKKG